jgi:hypothetical protein
MSEHLTTGPYLWIAQHNQAVLGASQGDVQTARVVQETDACETSESGEGGRGKMEMQPSQSVAK